MPPLMYVRYNGVMALSLSCTYMRVVYMYWYIKKTKLKLTNVNGPQCHYNVMTLYMTLYVMTLYVM